MLDVILDTLLDVLKLLPFLFLTYLILEWAEHKAGEKAKEFTARAGVFGPAVGGILGILPQCGFSASAASLYSGGVISIGTMFAVFLSTSDEMIPVMISEKADPVRILLLVGIKAVCGIAVGFLIDFALHLLGHRRENREFSHLCEDEHCHCENGIFRSALHHTVHIALFILLITFVLNTVIFWIGEETIGSLASGAGRFFLPFLTAVIGLIPNCAASVVLTQLFLEGVISTGAVLSGLLVGSGIGLLVLYRTHKHWKKNLIITAVLYAVGVVIGLIFDLIGIVI